MKPIDSAHLGSANNWRARIDVGLLTILGLPWLILRFDRTWLFAYSASSFGFIDPWIYFGYFLDLTQHLKTFKGAYFTTRLSWTIPGAIAYGIFPPLIAPYVLHLAVFYASILSFYFILRNTVSGRSALLGTVLMSCHGYFLRSMGWDYIDGAAIAYFLMTLWAATLAANAKAPGKWLFAAGALAALTLYCQLFLIVFSPLALGYYLFARRQFGRDQTAGAGKLFGWGFAAVTAALGVFNMLVNGRFFFFVNSMGTAAKLVVGHNPYNDASYRWLAGATWLVLPILATLAAILCLRAKEHILTTAPGSGGEFLLFWQRYLVLSVAMMVIWELIGQPVLQLSYYASYLIPPSFLALASLADLVLGRLRRWQFLIFMGVAVCVSLAPFVVRLDSVWMLQLQRRSIVWPLCVGVVAATLLSRKKQQLAVIGIVLLLAALAMLTAANSTRTWGKSGRADDPALQRYAFMTIVDNVRTVQQLDPKDNLFFWYNYDDPLGKLYRAAASTYGWSYRLQSENFPDIGPKNPPLQRRIVILSSDGTSALAQAAASLETLGLAPRLIARKTIREGPISWDMTEIEVSAISPDVPTRQ